MAYAYSYGIRNRYRPTALAPKAYGWSTRPQYQRADVPTALMGGDTGLADPKLLMQQFAYEWFQSGAIPSDYSSPTATVIGGANLTNPPFVSGASGRLLPSLRDSQTGQPARILRGFIRRADHEAGNSLSKARLYFMYNPETITRDYVSYLNQSALDPFNTVFQSGNLVPPPSFMDFSFTLFFDRQEEAAQADHPGVFVDYQFFDLVVRNVVPTDPNQNSNAIPDNGVMMVNPRDITVVFSPQITVQGRPLNAQVNFMKFTHRMTPTRMEIKLTMRVIYIGPMRDQVEYKAEELQSEDQIPFAAKDDLIPTSWLKNDEQTDRWWEQVGDFAGQAVNGLFPTWLGGTGALYGQGENAPEQFIDQLMRTSSDANDQARRTALAWAIAHVKQGGPGAKGQIDPGWTNYATKELANYATARHDLPTSADCSGLVCEAYTQTGNGQSMGWSSYPGTAGMISMAKQNNSKQFFIELSKFHWQWQDGKTEQEQTLQPGDILIREGHVVFFVKYDGGKLYVFDAASSTSSPEVGQRGWQPGDKKWYLLRPSPIAADSLAGQASLWNNPR